MTRLSQEMTIRAIRALVVFFPLMLYAQAAAARPENASTTSAIPTLFALSAIVCKSPVISPLLARPLIVTTADISRNCNIFGAIALMDGCLPLSFWGDQCPIS